MKIDKIHQQKQLVGYIAAILNINIDNDFVIIEIVHELSTVDDITDFISFIKTNFNNYNLSYQSGFQKFINLSKKYKEIKYPIDSPSNLKFLDEVCAKVELVRNSIGEYSNYDYDDVKIKADNSPLFSNKEKELLSEIGNLSKAIRLQKMISGADGLYEALKEIIAKKTLQKNKLILLSSKSQKYDFN
ncbi:MAG: hypothetical protein PHV08_05885 [Sulfurovaceae bacterium]|nr:hypothetical protein [Sulfurovaceae bacterium]